MKCSTDWPFSGVSLSFSLLLMMVAAAMEGVGYSVSNGKDNSEHCRLNVYH